MSAGLAISTILYSPIVVGVTTIDSDHVSGGYGQSAMMVSRTWKGFCHKKLIWDAVLTPMSVLPLALEAVEVEVSVPGPGGAEARPRPRQLALDVTRQAAELPDLGVTRPQPQPGLEAKTVFEHHWVAALHLGCHAENMKMLIEANFVQFWRIISLKGPRGGLSNQISQIFC